MIKKSFSHSSSVREQIALVCILNNQRQLAEDGEVVMVVTAGVLTPFEIEFLYHIQRDCA